MTLVGVWRYGLTVACLLASTSGWAADAVRPSGRVTSRLVVREGPSTSTGRVGALEPGDTATVIGDEPRWYQVRLSDGTEGYVSKAWAVRTEGAGPALTATTPVTADTAPVPIGALELHFIDAGQGDSTLIVCPNGRTILVDCGQLPHVSGDDIRKYLLEQLDRVGGRVDVVVVTHPDQDHYNLLQEVLWRVPFTRLRHVGGDERDYNEDVSGWMGRVGSKAVLLEEDDADQPGQPNGLLDCGAAQIVVLAANVRATKSPSNARSIVLMVRHGDFEAVLTGDATFDTENAILARYDQGWLDVDLLKVGHHGSRATSTSERWAKALSPEIAIVSAGVRSQHGHPRGEVLETLEPYHRRRRCAPDEFRDGKAGPVQMARCRGLRRGHLLDSSQRDSGPAV